MKNNNYQFTKPCIFKEGYLLGIILLFLFNVPVVKADHFMVRSNSPEVITDLSNLSLAGAISLANQKPTTSDNPHVIEFAAPMTVVMGATSYLTVNVPVVIDGTTVPDYKGIPLIRLDGSGISNTFYFILFRGQSQGSKVKGLFIYSNTLKPISGIRIEQSNIEIMNNVIGGMSGGISAINAHNTVIKGNFIGTDPTGTLLMKNGEGIRIMNSNGVIIGGRSLMDRNIISGNNYGVLAHDLESLLIEGNYIGVDISGKLALPNGVGLCVITNSKGVTIGGAAAGAGNIISGNTSGVVFDPIEGVISDIEIEGNIIGLSASGDQPIGNNEGIKFYNRGNGRIYRNVKIGGNSSDERNIISANNEGIIFLREIINDNVDFINVKIQGNYIGTDITGTKAIGNQGNGISCNAVIENMQIGGYIDGGNIISGNGKNGIEFNGAGGIASCKTLNISYNKIGTDVTGEFALPNNGGIVMGVPMTDVTILANVVSGNLYDAIKVQALMDHLYLYRNQIGFTPSGKILHGSGVGINIGSLSNSVYHKQIIIGGFEGSGNKIGGHASGGIKVGSVDRLEILANLIKDNYFDDIQIHNCDAFEVSYNTTEGNIIINTGRLGNVKSNNITNGGITLARETSGISILENTLGNTVNVIEGSRGNSINKNVIKSSTKPINLELTSSNPGNDAISSPIIQAVDKTLGIVRGSVKVIPLYGEPFVELFSSDEHGRNAYKYLGSALVDPLTGRWTAQNITFEESSIYIIASLTGLEANNDQHVNTSEFSAPFKELVCGTWDLVSDQPGCVSNTLTTLRLDFIDFPIMPSDYSVHVNYGDTDYEYTYAIDANQNFVSLNHQYELPGTYTITVDVGRYLRGDKSFHPCMDEAIILKLQVEDCFSCEECIPAFAPDRGKTYLLSAWVKEEGLSNLNDSITKVYFKYIESATPESQAFYPKGNSIDGWRRVEGIFIIPADATEIELNVDNEGTQNVYLDDVRIHPFNASMKSFVYDPVTLRLMSELDENNYATFYEYDEEGSLIRVKMETERGIMTIQESRVNTVKGILAK